MGSLVVNCRFYFLFRLFNSCSVKLIGIFECPKQVNKVFLIIITNHQLATAARRWKTSVNSSQLKPLPIHNLKMHDNHVAKYGGKRKNRSLLKRLNMVAPEQFMFAACDHLV